MKKLEVCIDYLNEDLEGSLLHCTWTVLAGEYSAFRFWNVAGRKHNKNQCLEAGARHFILYFIISNRKGNRKLVEITKRAEGFSSSAALQARLLAFLKVLAFSEGITCTWCMWNTLTGRAAAADKPCLGLKFSQYFKELLWPASSNDGKPDIFVKN